jgi:hypothetical protein
MSFQRAGPDDTPFSSFAQVAKSTSDGKNRRWGFDGSPNSESLYNGLISELRASERGVLNLRVAAQTEPSLCTKVKASL